MVSKRNTVRQPHHRAAGPVIINGVTAAVCHAAICFCYNCSTCLGQLLRRGSLLRSHYISKATEELVQCGFVVDDGDLAVSVRVDSDIHVASFLALWPAAWVSQDNGCYTAKAGKVNPQPGSKKDAQGQGCLDTRFRFTPLGFSGCVCEHPLSCMHPGRVFVLFPAVAGFMFTGCKASGQLLRPPSFQKRSVFRLREYPDVEKCMCR